MKTIRLVNYFNIWFWINLTDNTPPASNKEFKTKEECMRDARVRVGNVRFEEEREVVV